MKRWILSKIVTPKRARSWIAGVLSWLICHCMARGAWDALSATTAWLRRLADFIDDWNATELPADKDRLIADLVAGAVTDEMVGRLVDTVSALQAQQPAVVQPALPVQQPEAVQPALPSIDVTE